MRRVAYTIIFNGLQHLLHDDYAERLVKDLDLWVFVEGGALPGGSTSWCKPIPDRFHNHGGSVDGTREFLVEFVSKHPQKVRYNLCGGLWQSKDAMVNEAVRLIKKEAGEAFLWQIDVDEQWTSADMKAAEKALERQDAACGTFLCEYYVGERLRAIGEWGEGRSIPYRRLWRWKGQEYATHEPPEFCGGNGKTVLLPQRFDHYAYYYMQDIDFKGSYYQGHEGILERWLDLQEKEAGFPLPLSALFPASSPYCRTKTRIIRV